MNQPVASRSQGQHSSLQAQLIGVVDSMPATRGFGVCYRRGGRMLRVRPQPPGRATVVFEVHDRQIGAGWLDQMREHRGPWLQSPGSARTEERASDWLRAPPPPPPRPASLRPQDWVVQTSGFPFAPANVLTPQPGASVPHREGGTSVAGEWRSLGFNCGGAVLAWIGVAGAGAATPVTGGVSGIGSVLLYGGAVAASGQCLASVYRVHNATHGQASVNEALDRNSYYKWTMRVADGVVLVGAGGALLEARATNSALRAAGTSWSAAVQRTTTAAQRVDAAMEMELKATHIGSRVLSRLTRQRLLDGAAGVLSLYVSYDGGIIHELIVWVVEEKRS